MDLMHMLAIGGVIFSGIFFFAYAKKHTAENLSTDGYLLANKKVGSKAFANTFFASGTALGNIVFYIEFHKTYGYLVALFLMVYFISKFVILHYLKSIATDRSKYRTLAELWYTVFPSVPLARSIAIISAVTCFMSLFVELCISSVIISIFLPDTVAYRALAFCFMGLVVLGYVYYGGYGTVVKTDGWQLWLMITAAIAIVCFAIQAPMLSNLNFSEDRSFIAQLFSFQEEIGIPFILFAAWAILCNIGFGYTDAAVWQRLNAAASHKDSLKAMYKGFWKAIIILWAPILGFMWLYLKGYNYDSLTAYLNLLTEYSGLLGYIIFPVIVIGFSASLFSSADTSMIAAIYSLCDNSTFLPKLQQIPKKDSNVILKKYITLSCGILVILMSVLYYIQDTKLSNLIMPILYAVWNQLSILAPLSFFALYRLRNNMSQISVNNTNSTILMLFLFTAWGLILYGSWQSAITDDYMISHLVYLISLVLVTVGLYISVKIPEWQQSKNIPVSSMALRN